MTSHRFHRLAFALGLALLSILARADDLFTIDDVFTAIANGDAASMEQFLATGMSPDLRHPDGNTVLIAAARTGDAAIVKLLLGAGAKVYAKNALDEDAAMLSAYQGHDQVIDLLAAWGADFGPNRKGWTPLSYAAYAGRCETVAHLLTAYGVEVDQPIENGLTPLMLAANQGHLECVKSLLAAGADPNRKAGPGRTARKLAEKGGHTDIMDLLEEAGAKK